MAGGKFYKVQARPKSARQKKMEEVAKKQALKVLNRESEWKHHTLNHSVSVSTTPNVQDLCSVAQGDGDTYRDGDTLQASSINYRINMSPGDSTNFLRLIFVQYFPNTTPAATDILTISVGYETLAMYNTDQADQFKILSDRTYTMTDVGYNKARSISGKIQVSKKKMQYMAGTTNGSNHVYLIALSDSSAVAHPSYGCVTKLNFRDN